MLEKRQNRFRDFSGRVSITNLAVAPTTEATEMFLSLDFPVLRLRIGKIIVEIANNCNQSGFCSDNSIRNAGERLSCN